LLPSRGPLPAPASGQVPGIDTQMPRSGTAYRQTREGVPVERQIGVRQLIPWQRSRAVTHCHSRDLPQTPGTKRGDSDVVWCCGPKRFSAAHRVCVEVYTTLKQSLRVGLVGRCSSRQDRLLSTTNSQRPTDWMPSSAPAARVNASR
jgi:hypothetical protein